MGTSVKNVLELLPRLAMAHGRPQFYHPQKSLSGGVNFYNALIKKLHFFLLQAGTQFQPHLIFLRLSGIFPEAGCQLRPKNILRHVGG
jgi:hypothetical protein